MLRIALTILVLIVYPFESFAQSWCPNSWTTVSTTAHGSSQSAAQNTCDSSTASYASTYPEYYWRGIVHQEGYTWYCYVQRSGLNCEPCTQPDMYDEATGTCGAPPPPPADCATKAGQEQSYSTLQPSNRVDSDGCYNYCGIVIGCGNDGATACPNSSTVSICTWTGDAAGTGPSGDPIPPPENDPTQDPNHCSVKGWDGKCYDTDHPDNAKPPEDTNNDGVIDENDTQTEGCPANTTYGTIYGQTVCYPNATHQQQQNDRYNNRRGPGGTHDPNYDSNGNGIPDGQDPDADGDGIPNEQDSTPYGGGGGGSRLDGDMGSPTSQPGTGEGGTGSWWTSEYEGGLQGVWDEKSGDIADGAMGDWLGSFQFANSGSCPALPISFDLGFISFGSGDVLSGYCWIWDVIRAIVLLSAVFTARKLIFGG